MGISERGCTRLLVCISLKSIDLVICATEIATLIRIGATLRRGSFSLGLSVKRSSDYFWKFAFFRYIFMLEMVMLILR